MKLVRPRVPLQFQRVHLNVKWSTGSLQLSKKKYFSTWHLKRSCNYKNFSRKPWSLFLFRQCIFVHPVQKRSTILNFTYYWITRRHVRIPGRWHYYYCNDTEAIDARYYYHRILFRECHDFGVYARVDTIRSYICDRVTSIAFEKWSKIIYEIVLTKYRRELLKNQCTRPTYDFFERQSMPAVTRFVFFHDSYCVSSVQIEEVTTATIAIIYYSVHVTRMHAGSTCQRETRFLNEIAPRILSTIHRESLDRYQEFSSHRAVDSR